VRPIWANYTPYSILWLDPRAEPMVISVPAVAKERYDKDSPGADKAANWLPAPNDTIYLVMRLYWPKTEAPSILPPGEGTWQPPGVVAQ
jgi:hypothetical protein